MENDKKKFLKKTESVNKPNPKLKLKNAVRKLSGTIDSLKPLEDLVQCGICLEKLKDPKMLPCQHTFCLTCLQTHLLALNLVVQPNPPTPEQIKFSLSADVKRILCPVCQKEVVLENGLNSIDKLPNNMYIASLLKLLEQGSSSSSPASPRSTDFRCVKCQTVSEEEERVCHHCMQIFCSICWNDHLTELESNLSMLIRQIEESENRLKHKAENFITRCDQVTNNIKEATKNKIINIQNMEKNAIDEVKLIKTQSNVLYENISRRVEDLKTNIETSIKKTSNNKIITYVNIHKETAKIFNEIYHYGEARIVFDPDKFQIDQDTEGIYNEIEENSISKLLKNENPLDSIKNMSKFYKSKAFVPKLIWNKCPRPGGVGIPPWDSTKIYITATDSHNILILDKAKFKLLGNIRDANMLCPTSLAFASSSKEIFVTDKWKHCIHVFSCLGEYLKCFMKLKLRSPDGIAIGPNNEIVVCDTANNRIVIADSITGETLSIIGEKELSLPTSVVVYGKNIIVADTGNNRIKVLNLDGEVLQIIGSMGRNKGQFRSAEVVTVDALGFIIVGDAGNARIQVFQPDGTLVKIFGSKGGFNWISGIHVTSDLDIIVTDRKNRSLTIF